MDAHKSTDREENYHTYESHPIPWWLALKWLLFFIFAFIYLLRNLWHG